MPLLGWLYGKLASPSRDTLPCPGRGGDTCTQAPDGQHSCEGDKGHPGLGHFCFYCKEWF